MHRIATRHMRQGRTNLIIGFGRQCSFAALVVLIVFGQVFPAAIQPIGLVRFIVFADLEFRIQVGLKRGFHFLDFALGDQPVADQPFGV